MYIKGCEGHITNSLCEWVIQMYRAILATICVLVSTHYANASCDVSKGDLLSLKLAEATFRAEPSKMHAEAFLNELPSRFCEFNLTFGWIDDEPTPLYDVPLHQSLPSLPQFIPAKTLAKKYVALASQAQWALDNINELQSAYNALFLEHPDIVIDEILALPIAETHIAVRFLFDGITPRNSFLTSQEKQELCEISDRFCDLINLTENALTEEVKER